MKKQQVDFATKDNNQNDWYDLFEDWDLIEASIAKQYGIRIRSVAHEMSWTEFSGLVHGIMPDTPLGQVVSIRSETDKKVIKSFSPYQKKIYNDWRLRQANKQLNNPETINQRLKDLERSLELMFGGK